MDLLDSHIRDKRTACNLTVSELRETITKKPTSTSFIENPTRNPNLEVSLTSLSQLKLQTILKQSARLG